MLQVIEKVNHFIQPILWGWPVLICILLAGILFTVRLRFFQFTKIGLWMKLTFAGMFRRKKQSNDGISPFQALTTALAGSIGTGNIVGVATALTLGGPGAIFWMWISALLGMMTIYAETVLGMKYRKKDKNGKWLGGAMYANRLPLYSPLPAYWLPLEWEIWRRQMQLAEPCRTVLA